MKIRFQYFINCCLLFFLFFLPISEIKANYHFDDQDTLVVKVGGVPKDAAALMKDAEKTKKSIIKKIGDALKFTKNARAREKTRITEIVGAMGITDTVQLDIARLQDYIEAIAKSDTQQYHIMMRLMDSVRMIAAKKKDTAYIIQPPVFPPVVEGNPEIQNATGGAVIPVAQIESDTKNKRVNLSAIRELAKVGGIKEVSYTEGSVVKKDLYQLRKKGAIHAFYNSATPYDFSNTPFNIYDVLVYDALQINASNGLLTGRIDKNIIAAAQKANCKVYFTTIAETATIKNFLFSDAAQQNFIASCRDLLKTYHADGINLNFKNLSSFYTEGFDLFLQKLSQALKGIDTNYQICLTLPIFDEQKTYNLKYIDPYINTYYIDFTAVSSTKQAAPLAPATGFKNNNITTSIAYYLNQQIDASKFIVNLPYGGAQWTIYNNSKKPDVFNKYLTYAAIRKQYNMPVFYDKSLSAYMDTTFKGITQRIWFDDANTLAQKYSLILDNGLGGAGISYLGSDGNYGELNDMLAYSFFAVDTLPLPDSSLNTKLSFWQKMYRHWVLYNYILTNPCEMCFENAVHENNGVNIEDVYVHQLGIDSIVIAHNIETAAANLKKDSADRKPLMTAFFYVNNQLNHVMLGMCLLFLILSAITAYIYIYFLKNVSDKWRYKKPVGWTLVVLLLFFVLTLFGDLFTNDLIPFFGVSSGVPTFDGVDLTKTALPPANADECMPDKSCVNMSFYLLTSIILIGSIIGVVIGKYLIFPILKKDSVP